MNPVVRKVLLTTHSVLQSTIVVGLLALCQVFSVVYSAMNWHWAITVLLAIFAAADIRRFTVMSFRAVWRSR